MFCLYFLFYHKYIFLKPFRTSGYQGDVTINGSPRDLLSFRNVSSYIMQEDHLQLYLTVQESIEVAMKLKYSIIKLNVQNKISVSK